MTSDLKGKLTQLKELHELGLLTDADFQRQKDALIATVMGFTAATPPSSLPGATRRKAFTPTGSDESVFAPSLAGPTTVGASVGIPSRIGNYTVSGIIGAGGMGTVVRARHIEEGWSAEQGGDVALKLIHPRIAEDAEFRRRFFAEAGLGRRVKHPGLATV